MPTQQMWIGRQPGHIVMMRGFKGTFTRNVKSMLSENLGGILGGTQC
jgi:hypothetical protein